MVAPFHPCCPAGCPSDQAAPPAGPVFRAARTFPVTDVDVVSDAARGRRGVDKSNCLNWGLSVWTSKEAVDYARKVLPFTKRRYIVDLVVDAQDGMIQHTPTTVQNEHHTFWPYDGRDIKAHCQIYLDPEPL